MIMKVAGFIFVALFSGMEVFTLWHQLPAKFSFSEFFELNSLMPTVTMIVLFAFFFLLGMFGMFNRITGVIASFIGLIVVFIEMGDKNMIATVTSGVETYLSGVMGSITVTLSLTLVAFGFVLILLGSILPSGYYSL